MKRNYVATFGGGWSEQATTHALREPWSYSLQIKTECGLDVNGVMHSSSGPTQVTCRKCKRTEGYF